MQSKLRQKLLLQAGILIDGLFPEAKCTETVILPRGWRAWKLNSGTDITMHLIVGTSDKDDSFSIEIAWSTQGRLPENNGGHPDDDQNLDEICFRLSRLWHRYGMEHRWYLGSTPGTQEITIPPYEPFDLKFESIAPQIEDAFEKLRQYGVPYLKKIAVRYGAELSVIEKSDDMI